MQRYGFRQAQSGNGSGFHFSVPRMELPDSGVDCALVVYFCSVAAPIVFIMMGAVMVTLLVVIKKEKVKL